MTLSMYDVSVPAFQRTLRAFDILLEKAEEHCVQQGLDPRQLIEARLASDMQPFAFQIAALINHSVGAVAQLQDAPRDRATPQDDLAAMREALKDATRWLAAVSPADLDGSEAREIVLPHPRGARHFTGQGYLLSLALPNFYFHAATGYDILRHQGLDIGKRDFLGELPPRRPNAYAPPRMSL